MKFCTDNDRKSFVWPECQQPKHMAAMQVKLEHQEARQEHVARHCDFRQAGSLKCVLTFDAATQIKYGRACAQMRTMVWAMLSDYGLGRCSGRMAIEDVGFQDIAGATGRLEQTRPRQFTEFHYAVDRTNYCRSRAAKAVEQRE
eukprot:555068-Amphidinium_carterae.2